MNQIKEFIAKELSCVCKNGCTDRYLRELACAYLIIGQLLAFRAGINSEKRMTELNTESRGELSFYTIFIVLLKHCHIISYVWGRPYADIITVRSWYLSIANSIQNIVRQGIYD